jgi:hypothetical protein
VDGSEGGNARQSSAGPTDRTLLSQTAFTEILDTLLLPLLNRVFNFLESPIAGTDDAVQHSQLRRAYFNFILSITAANMQEVFYSESELRAQARRGEHSLADMLTFCLVATWNREQGALATDPAEHHPLYRDGLAGTRATLRVHRAQQTRFAVG